MTIGTMRDFVLPLFIRESVRHIERSEDTLLQKLAERLTRNFFYHHGQDGVTGIAVVPLRARGKLAAGLVLEKLEHARVVNLRNSIARRADSCLRHQIFVVAQARGMVKEVAHSDGFAVGGKLRKDIAEAVVIMQLAVAYQQHDGGGGELFGR